MNEATDLLRWLALARLFHSCPHLAIKLLEAAGNIEEVFRLSAAHALAILEKPYAAVEALRAFHDWKACENDLALCRRHQVDIVTFSDERYPALLRMIHDPPVVLFVRGDSRALGEDPCVAVVGARKATPGGCSLSHDVAKNLAARGVTIVSGMAYGVDRAAHEGALAAGGRTVAVWGTGPDIVYPRAHRHLATRIEEAGAAITEFPPATAAAPHHFPQRNRVISGLCLSVVVVEAAENSGSLITARCALEQGRDVCAVPGGVGLVAHRGSNRLIKQGAFLVEEAQDVVDAVFARNEDVLLREKAGQAKKASVRQSRLLLEDPLLGCLSAGEIMGLDELIQISGIDAATVMERIMQLELEDIVEELPGKRYRLKADDTR